MSVFILSLISGIFLAFIYRKARHKDIFPKASSENVYAAWLKMVIVISVPILIIWIAERAVQSFPD